MNDGKDLSGAYLGTVHTSQAEVALPLISHLSAAPAPARVPVDLPGQTRSSRDPARALLPPRHVI